MATLELQPRPGTRRRDGGPALIDAEPAGEHRRPCPEGAGRTQQEPAMVRGLDLFRAWFADFADQYILIGGTAASLAMHEAGLEFRATKDLDIVLHVEVLTPAFGAAFWTFIDVAGYQIRQSSKTGKPIFYRFQQPKDARYPAMLELFARAPDGLDPAPGSELTPIPLDEAVSSLSAILLDEDYYAFTMAGRREVGGLPLVGEDRL